MALREGIQTGINDPISFAARCGPQKHDQVKRSRANTRDAIRPAARRTLVLLGIRGNCSEPLFAIWTCSGLAMASSRSSGLRTKNILGKSQRTLRLTHLSVNNICLRGHMPEADDGSDEHGQCEVRTALSTCWPRVAIVRPENPSRTTRQKQPFMLDHAANRS